MADIEGTDRHLQSLQRGRIKARESSETGSLPRPGPSAMQTVSNSRPWGWRLPGVPHRPSVHRPGIQPMIWRLVLLLCLCGPAAHGQDRTVFSDPLASGGEGPRMAMIEPGQFRMGCVSGFRCKDNRPAHEVSLQRPFSLSVHEITRGEFQAFVDRTGYRTDAKGGSRFGGIRNARVCMVFSLAEVQATDYNITPAPRTWLEPGFPQTNDHPVVCITWSDASAYVRWLASETGRPYRLPTEAEWEYAARANVLTGEVDVSSFCNDRDVGSEPDCVGDPFTLPAGHGEPNAFGLYGMERNAYEWVGDCWVATFQGAPADGSARIETRCRQRIVRGGAWSLVYVPHELRTAFPNEHSTHNQIGFRVAQSPVE